MDWKTIESAPRTSEPLLLRCPELLQAVRPDGLADIIVGVWVEGEDWESPGWYSDYAEMESSAPGEEALVHQPLKPTHWTRLPRHPVSPGRWPGL